MTTPSKVSYRRIKLTQGQYALVDASDFEWLDKYKWHAYQHQSGKFYALRSATVNGKKFHISMHRQILGLDYGDPRIADHRDPERTLDNRRKNLRTTDHSGNARNRGIQKNNRTGFKGVYYDASKGGFLARIRAGGKQINLGGGDTPEKASVLYQAAAERLHGEFARLR